MTDLPQGIGRRVNRQALGGQIRPPDLDPPVVVRLNGFCLFRQACVTSRRAFLERLLTDAGVGLALSGPGAGNTVSMIDGASCDATVTAGCDQTPPTVTSGSGPDGVAIDQATATVYVVNAGADTVSVIDGATCNATHTSGCRRTQPTIAVGGLPNAVAVDQATHTVYVANYFDDNLSVFGPLPPDTRR